MADNPFQSPVAPSTSSQSNDSHSIIRAWERMRFFYNTIVGVIGLVGLALSCITNPNQILEAFLGAFVFAIFANVCFMAGPLAEFYWSFFKKSSEVPEIRWPLFIAGTGLSILPIMGFTLSTIF